MSKQQSSNSIGAQLQSKGVALPVNKQNNEMNNKSLRQDFVTRVDGYDHINVDVSGETDLGRYMAFDAHYEFTLPKYGSFSSIRALHTFLSTIGHPNHLRHMHPQKLREYAWARDQAGQKFEHPELAYICAYVLADKMDNDQVKQAVKEIGDIPLKSYYIANGVPRTHGQAFWWLDVCNDILDSISRGQEPDISDYAFAAQSFEEACIDLPTAVRVGMFQAPVAATKAETKPKKEVPTNKEKEPKKAKKRPPYVPREFGQAPKYRDLTPAELDINELNTRTLGVIDRKLFGEVFKFLSELPEGELKDLIQQSNHVTVIPVSMSDNDVGPDDVKYKFVMSFDPETYKFTGLASDFFHNPLILNDTQETVEVEADATEEKIFELVRKAAGIPEGSPCEIKINKVPEKTAVEKTVNKETVIEEPVTA